MKEKQIYIIRHGETDNNLHTILQGGNIDLSINEKGKEQSYAFYDAYKHLLFKKIYTSKLKRSIESVDPFIQSGIPHESCEDLNEISYGIYDGKVSSQEPNGIYEQLLRKWRAGEVNARMEGGESPLDVQKRVHRFITEMMKREEEDAVLICMHGRAMRIFLATLFDFDLSLMDEFKHSNLCLYQISYNGSFFKIEKFNDTSHLKDFCRSRAAS